MSAIDDHRAALEGALSALDEAGLRRRPRLPSGIDLVSNDYLGFAEHEAIRRAMAAYLDEGPAGSSGSRLLRGHKEVFEELEARLAALSGSESTLFFGSGYLANLGLLPALAGKEDLVVSDERNHASLIDGIRLSGAEKVVTPHNDVAAVEQALRRPRKGRAFVVTESVFSMDGDFAPLGELASVCALRGALLVVDEAHATGLHGRHGAGLVEELGLRAQVLATVHTGGKALGVGGAWVAGSSALRETLVNKARSFIFSTAPPPAMAAGLLAALDLLAREGAFRRTEVARKASLLRGELRRRRVPAAGASAIVPVVVGANEAALRLQDGLQQAGFDARAVRPPTVPAGTARLRVTVRHPVSDGDLSRFAEACEHLLGSRAA